MEITREIIMDDAILSSRVTGSSELPTHSASAISTSACGRPTSGAPVVENTDARERTRSGCSIAMVWAIIPPIEQPTTCACSTPRVSRTPMPSAAMSLSE